MLARTEVQRGLHRRSPGVRHRDRGDAGRWQRRRRDGGCRAVINVVQPYTSGIGGAGFFVIYLAAEDRFVTINSGALSPLAFDRDAMLENGEPIPDDEYETSG